MTRHATPISLVLVLALTMMLGPFSLDTYLPAFPHIGADLGVDQAAVALTVSAYIFTLALGQLLGGALSDRFGRRLVLLGGLGLYAAASLAIAAAGTMDLLLGARVAQALGGGWVVVSVPALVRDRVSGREAAKLFSLLGLIMVLAPAVAPGVGSALLGLGSWRWIFVALGAYAVLLLPLTQRFIFRGLARRPRSARAVGMGRRYLAVLGERAALPYILWQAAAMSVMMIFITHASAVYQGHFGQSERAFSLLFAANIVTMLGFLQLNRMSLNRYPALPILRLATVAQAIGVVWLLAAAFGGWGLGAFLPAMMLTIGAMGAISPNIQACFLDFFPESGGTAAALLGAAQFSLAGLASALSTRMPETVESVVLAMAGCAGVAFCVMVGTWMRETRMGGASGSNI